MDKSAAVSALFLKAQQIFDNASRLSLLSFPSERPRDFALFLCEVCKRLQDLILQGHFNEVDERLVTMTTIFLVDEVAPMVRFIEGASSDNTPANLVLPLEKIGEATIAGAKFIVRRQWHYNYAAVELRSVLEPPLLRLPAKAEWQHVLDKLPSHLYAISFPYLEKDNAPLHVSLAHEIGHHVAQRYLAEEDGTEILDELHADIAQKITTEDAVQRAEEVGRGVTRANRLRQAALVELLSDAVSAHVFGPAALFALYEISSLSESMDKISADMHPPWHLRIWHMLEVLHELDFINKQSLTLTSWPQGLPPSVDQVKPTIDEWLGNLRVIVSERKDLAEIEKHVPSTCAYASVRKKLPDIRKFAAANCPKPAYEQSHFREEVPKLLERLYMGLPPNQVEHSLTKTQDVRLASILGSAWLYKLTCLASVFERDPKQYVEQVHTLHRLILKAIELCEVKTQYRESERKQREGGRGVTE